MRKFLKIIPFILTVLTVLFIWFNSFMNSDNSELQSGFVLDLFNNIGITVSEHFIRKMAHFSEYFLLGLLVTIDFNVITKSTKYLTVMLSCFLTGIFTALIDESIQTFTPGRAGMVMDVWLDFSGFLFAFSFMTIYIKSHYMVK